MPPVITDAELEEIRQDSERKGVIFTPAQMEKIRQILQRRLERAERVRQQQYEQAKQKLQRDLEREHMEVLEKSDRLKEAAAQVRSLIDSAKQYELMHQGHFEHVDQEDSRPA